MRGLKIFTDGSFSYCSKLKQRTGGAGLYVPAMKIGVSKKLIICQDSWHAELQALLFGFEWARRNTSNFQCLSILTDHQVLARQLLQSTCKIPRLNSWELEIRKWMIHDFSDHRLDLNWIPRIQNNEADELAHQGRCFK